MIRRVLAVLALVVAMGLRVSGEETGGDEAALRRLNGDYVRAFLACDVGRFKAMLADDFESVLANGRVIDRAEFLRQAARAPDVKDFRLRDVSIRIYADVAVVRAMAGYRRADGVAVQTRYTNVCVRKGDRWVIVSTQWTRIVD